MIDKNSIHVIIRSAGERTEEVCRNLLENECGFKQLRVIHEVPFSKAISKGFEIGLESGKPWMLCIDADVLVDRDGMYRLLDVASAISEDVFEVQGLVRDKFFPVNRPAGNHLYRMKYASEALKCIPKEGTTLRPESTMLKTMVTKGYPWYQSDVVIGIHDFEQYYADIFRKCFLHTRKHDYLMPEVMPYWIEQSKTDIDFEVAIMGVAYSLAHKSAVEVRSSLAAKETIQCMESLCLDEKQPLHERIMPDYVLKLLKFESSLNKELSDIITPSRVLNKYHEVQPLPDTLRSSISRKLKQQVLLLHDFFQKKN